MYHYVHLLKQVIDQGCRENYIYVYVCFACWLELDSSIALCNIDQFMNPICYLYQYFSPQWDLFQDIQLPFGLSRCKQRLLI